MARALFTILTLFSSFSYGKDLSYFSYQLKKGDSLGHVLQSFGLSPLWGPGGYVARTKNLNQDLVQNSNELPDAGTWIKIPKPSTNWTPPGEPLQVAEARTNEVPVSTGKEDLFSWYQLKNQDSIGSVLYQKQIGPLWGPKGMVAKTVFLNKDLIKNANELPPPGTWIRIPQIQKQKTVVSSQKPTVTPPKEKEEPVSLEAYSDEKLKAVKSEVCSQNKSEKYKLLCSLKNASRRPASTQAPMAEEVFEQKRAKQSKQPSNYGQFKFVSHAFSSRIGYATSDGKKGNIITDFHLGGSLDWGKTLSKDLELISDFSYWMMTFNTTGQQVDNPDGQSYFSANTGLRYWTSKYLSIDLSAGLHGDKLVEQDDTSILLGTGYFPKLQLSTRYSGFFWGSSSFSMEGGVNYMLSGSTNNLKVQYGYGFYLMADQRVAISENQFLGLAFLWDFQGYKASLASNARFSAGGQIYWSWTP